MQLSILWWAGLVAIAPSLGRWSLGALRVQPWRFTRRADGQWRRWIYWVLPLATYSACIAAGLALFSGWESHVRDTGTAILGLIAGLLAAAVHIRTAWAIITRDLRRNLYR
jgi:hypothetical protein